MPKWPLPFLCILVMWPVGEPRADWALAFGKSGSTRWSWQGPYDHSDQATAVNTALRLCGNRLGARCRILAKGASGCFALAVAQGGNGYGYGYTNSRDGAASRAMVECTKHNPAGCALQGAYCDTSHGFQPGTITEADQAAYEAAMQSAASHRATEGRRRRTQQTFQQSQQAQEILNGIAAGIAASRMQRTSPAPRYAPVGPSQSGPSGTGSSGCFSYTGPGAACR